MQRNDFQKVWGFPSEVLETVNGATSFTVFPASTPSAYKSGRRRYIVAFADANGNVVETRNGMRLVSAKTGKDYDVCLRSSA